MNPLVGSLAMMRPTHTVFLFALLCQTVTAQSPSASAAAEREAVLAVVQAFFDTMAAKDVVRARQILIPEGRLYAVREQDGKPAIRARTNEEYLKHLPEMKTRVRERMWNPEVRIQGFIATVWTPYDFWIDGKLSHCGVDAFQLIKTDQGWKIAGGSYTIENKCEASPQTGTR
jgi:hypothetical protein